MGTNFLSRNPLHHHLDCIIMRLISVLQIVRMAILFLLGVLYRKNQCSFFTRRITLEPPVNTLGCLLEREKKKITNDVSRCIHM